MKADSKLLHTPVEEVCGNPKDRGVPAGATKNGAPGLPHRTESKYAVDEVTYAKEE